MTMTQVGTIIGSGLTAIFTAIFTVYFVNRHKEIAAIKRNRRQIYSQLIGRKNTLSQFYNTFIEKDTMCAFYKSASNLGLIYGNTVLAKDYERYIKSHDDLIVEIIKYQGDLAESLSSVLLVFNEDEVLAKKISEIEYASKDLREYLDQRHLEVVELFDDDLNKRLGPWISNLVHGEQIPTNTILDLSDRSEGEIAKTVTHLEGCLFFRIDCLLDYLKRSIDDEIEKQKLQWWNIR